MYCSYTKPTRRQKILKHPTPLTENIKNLIPTTEKAKEKPPRYQSKYSNAVKDFYESCKLPHKTMGYYKTPLRGPNDFLKKHSREKKTVEIKSCGFSHNNKQIPSVPSKDNKTNISTSVPEDFVKENMRNPIRTPARKPTRKVVDSQKGTAVLLEFSGLVPKYSCKKEYGQKPKYLVKRQTDMDYSQKMFENFVAEQKQKGCPVKLSSKERKDLIEGLKKAWAEVNREYLGLPLVADTLRKKARKEQLEQRLKTLEKDIELLEGHDDIYIASTS